MEQENITRRPTWNQISCPDVEPRSSHASILHKNYMITCGGWNNSPLAEILVLDILKQQWKPVKIEKSDLTARYGHTMCTSQNDQIIIFGGRSPNVLSDVLIMTLTDIEEKILRIECEEVMIPKSNRLFRCRHTAHIHNDKMYVFGGLDKNLGCNNELWKLDLNTFTWIQCKTHGSDIPKERSSHCSILYKGRIYVFGGVYSRHAPEQSIRLNDLHMLNLGTMEWHRISPQGKIPPRMYGSSALIKDENFVLFGGYKENGECINDTFLYDINSNEFSELVTEGERPVVREYQTMVEFQDQIIVFGGWSNIEDVVADIYALNIGPIKSSQPLLRAIKPVVDLKSLFLEKAFADVMFVVEDQEFPAHKAILAKSCKYFHSMFTSGMTESHSQKIEIQDIKPPVFSALLEFIYCAKANIEDSIMREVMILSDKFGLLELKIKCEERLAGELNDDNFVELAHLAVKFECDVLLQTILKFIVINGNELKNRPDFCDLPKSVSEFINSSEY